MLKKASIVLKMVSLVLVQWAVLKLIDIKTEFIFHVFICSALNAQKCCPVGGGWQTTSEALIPTSSSTVVFVTK